MVVEDMEIDDYSRDRSRSPPRRDRSRSPERRDRSPPQGRRGGRGGGREPRGGFRGGRGGFRDRESRFGGRGGDDYRTKADRNHENTIFVGNLPFNCQWYELKDHFKSVGEIARADIVTSHGRSKGMGTVEFKSKQDVDRLIQEFNHSTFLNREIFVRQDLPPPSDGRQESSQLPRRERDRGSRFDDRRAGSGRFEDRRERRAAAAAPPPEGCEIFVGNLPFRTNWQDLKDLFRSVGDVVRADVRMDDRGRSKGFGTVVFSNKEDLIKARESFDKYEIEGRRIDVREGKVFAPRREEAPLPVNLNSPFTEGVTGGNGTASDTIFADNLPFLTTNEDLFDLFETIGKVEQLEIKFTLNGRNSGSAVVRFSNMDDATLAIEKLNNYEYGNRPLRLSFAMYPGELVPVEQLGESMVDQVVEPVAEQPVEQPFEQPIEQPVELAEPIAEASMTEDAPVQDAPVQDAPAETQEADIEVEN